MFDHFQLGAAIAGFVCVALWQLLSAWRKKKNEPPFRYRVTDMFRLSGPNTVFSGTIESGHVAVGELVVVLSPNGKTLGRIVGIERKRKFLDRATFGDNVGLSVSISDLAPVADGFERVDKMYRNKSLRLESPEFSGWRFWRWRG